MVPLVGLEPTRHGDNGVWDHPVCQFQHSGKIKEVNFDIENEAWNPVIRWNGVNPTIVNNRNTRDLIGRILKGEFYKIQ